MQMFIQFDLVSFLNFSIIVRFYHSLFYRYFTHVTASSTVIDDVTYYTTCILWYSMPTYNNKLLFTVKYDQNHNLIGGFNVI